MPTLQVVVLITVTGELGRAAGVGSGLSLCMCFCTFL